MISHACMHADKDNHIWRETYPAIQVQWAQIILPSSNAMIQASLASSGDRWLGFTLAFSKTYFFPKCWKVKEKTLLTYPAWKKLYESSCFHDSKGMQAWSRNEIGKNIAELYLKTEVVKSSLNLTLFFGKYESSSKKKQLWTVSQCSVILQVPQGYESSLTLTSLMQQLNLLPSNGHNGRRNSHI